MVLSLYEQPVFSLFLQYQELESPTLYQSDLILKNTMYNKHIPGTRNAGSIALGLFVAAITTTLSGDLQILSIDRIS